RLAWGLVVDPLFERLAFQQLHGDEVASAVFANLVDGADVRMVQSGGRARFALKTFQRKRIFFRLGRQELECDVAAKVDVLGFVNNAHPSAAQLGKDTVVRDGLADHGLADHAGEHSWERAIHVRPEVGASQTCPLFFVGYRRLRDGYTMRRGEKFMAGSAGRLAISWRFLGAFFSMA